MNDIQTFLRKFSRIPFGEMPKVLLIAWERFSEIKHAFTDKQHQQEYIQELMSKLLEDVRNINEELSEFINSPSWNRPTFYNDDDELYSSVENLVPIPSEFKGIFEDIYDVPSYDHFDAECGLINSLLSRDILITSPKIDFLPEEFVGELDFIDPILPGIDEDDCDEDDFDEEEREIDNEILQIEDEILREKLLNVNIIVDKIEALKLTSSILLCLNIPPLLLFPLWIGGGEIDVSQNIEDDDSFAFVIQTFLPYHTYPVDSPLLLSTGSEDTIFDPVIST
ncbi:hypothetical protein Tco_0328349 [Tanacetum coccineum]